MKISPISYNNLQQKSQNFNGLWGRTSSSTDFDESLGVPKVEITYYYYPFKHESESEIQRVVADSKTAFFKEEDGVAKYNVQDCKICATLPFTKDNFDSYINLTPENKLSPVIKLVHSAVQDKYINNDYGFGQKSAINGIVSQKLFDLNA